MREKSNNNKSTIDVKARKSDEIIRAGAFQNIPQTAYIWGPITDAFQTEYIMDRDVLDRSFLPNVHPSECVENKV